VINIHKKEQKANVKIIEELLYCLQLKNYFTNVIKNRLHDYLEDEMVEEECCFRKGRSCTDAIFTVQQIMEKGKNTTYRYLFYLLTTKRHMIT